MIELRRVARLASCSVASSLPPRRLLSGPTTNITASARAYHRHAARRGPLSIASALSLSSSKLLAGDSASSQCRRPCIIASPCAATATAAAMSSVAAAPAPEPPATAAAAAPPKDATTSTDPCENGAAPSPSSSPAAAAATEPAPLPPLSAAEFRGYNRLAEHMDRFHAHFRSSWETLYGAASSSSSSSSSSRQRRLSPAALVGAGLAFVSQLETHHTIEETYIFPVLARRMPEFRAGGGSGSNKGGGGAAELLRQHREIHKGMDDMAAYLRRCRTGEADLEMAALKAHMDSWGAVLWTHLDQEVETLGAENMRKYWTIEEIRRIPM
ncbi:hypothetical protein GGR56DRAFT_628082 [Xylariaceae sp. FL0804]|nr:hypothetical protein GGR56DRAFT_628082 [Xylariaceae sp. FL0804]